MLSATNASWEDASHPVTKGHPSLPGSTVNWNLTLLFRSRKPDGEASAGGDAPEVSALPPPHTKQHPQRAHRVHAQRGFPVVSAER